LIQGKLLNYGEDFSGVNYIWKEVFESELGLTIDQKNEPEDLMLSVQAIAYRGSDMKEPVAAGRIIYDGQTCYLDRVAVLKEYRNNYYGDFIVRMLLNKAFISNIQKVYIKISPNLEDFFKKFGFSRDIADIKEKHGIIMYIVTDNVNKKCLKSSNIGN
jgi:predicted GNAT family N-acyltransferase